MSTPEGTFPKVGGDPLYVSEFNKTPPIGSIMAWLKSFTGTPSLPSNWVECNGQVLDDADSVYNGETIPNLNGDNRFLRGESTSGGIGGSETHTHSLVLGGANYRFGTAQNVLTTTSTTSTLPTYYEVVWIMKIK